MLPVPVRARKDTSEVSWDVASTTLCFVGFLSLLAWVGQGVASRNPCVRANAVIGERLRFQMTSRTSILFKWVKFASKNINN